MGKVYYNNMAKYIIINGQVALYVFFHIILLALYIYIIRYKKRPHYRVLPLWAVVFIYS